MNTPLETESLQPKINYESRDNSLADLSCCSSVRDVVLVGSDDQPVPVIPMEDQIMNRGHILRSFQGESDIKVQSSLLRVPEQVEEEVGLVVASALVDSISGRNDNILLSRANPHGGRLLVLLKRFGESLPPFNLKFSLLNINSQLNHLINRPG